MRNFRQVKIFYGPLTQNLLWFVLISILVISILIKIVHSTTPLKLVQICTKDCNEQRGKVSHAKRSKKQAMEEKVGGSCDYQRGLAIES